MATTVVEQLAIGKDNVPSLGKGMVTLVMNGFGLEGSKKALDDNIVITNAGLAHAGLDIPGCEQRLVGVAGILAAADETVQQGIRLTCRSLGLECRPQRPLDQLCSHGCINRPANHLAREEVDHNCQIKPVPSSGSIGHVSYPFLIGLYRGKLLVEHIDGDGQAMVGTSGHVRLLPPFALALNPMSANRPLHSCPAAAFAMLTQLGRHPLTTVDAITLPVNRTNPVQQLLIFLLALTRMVARLPVTLPLTSLLVPADQDIQQATQPAHWVVLAFLLYEGELHLDSCVNIARAFFRMSRFCRSTFSHRSCRSSSFSGLGRPWQGNDWAPSTRALRTHSSSVPSPNHRPGFNFLTFFSLAVASSTASCLNSLLYVLQFVLIVTRLPRWCLTVVVCLYLSFHFNEISLVWPLKDFQRS